MNRLANKTVSGNRIESTDPGPVARRLTELLAHALAKLGLDVRVRGSQILHLALRCGQRLGCFARLNAHCRVKKASAPKRVAVVHRVFSDQENGKFVFGVADYRNRRQGARGIAL